MTKCIIAIPLVLMLYNVHAQDHPSALPGEYYLRGVMETASGFQLSPDSSFAFFYSYGMLDRFGKGTWTLKNNRVILTSRPRPPVDFRLLNSRSKPGDSITVVIRDNNEVLLRYVHCQLKTPNGIRELKTNEEGIARFPREKMDSIGLLFQLCPDRFSIFAVNNQDNYFEFGFEPWIVEVFFDHFELQWANGELTGPHPLIQGNAFHYEKARQQNER